MNDNEQSVGAIRHESALRRRIEDMENQCDNLPHHERHEKMKLTARIEELKWVLREDE